MNVRDFIAYLQTQDPDAIVRVVRDKKSNYTDVADFDPVVDVDYSDFRNNRFVKPEDPWYNKRYLTLGQF